MQLGCFYHAYTGGHWQEPLGEYLDALDGFDGYRGLGVVGPTAERLTAITTFMDRCGWPQDVRSAAQGFEEVTLNAVREYAHNYDGAVLYAHTKGAANPTEHNRRWRRAMTDALVARWVERLACLDAGEADVISCFWVRGWPGEDSTFPGGNFWMARCDWLRTLGPVGTEHRFQCEEWVGNRGGPEPRVIDVLPGSPHPSFFGL